ncbi:uroporphyrinogen decarboxylase [uncultured Pseudokineococcus sp.]|uniref:uroporphyrinogen decarboxylase n=1 Tax=uncultured Pseudokineococcus sp. TaxID=1642928 RepID=UPI00260453B3|nr:uroporphyrinogen decarboxylase [uncultured Pseudokineococcus sp.]
MPDTTRTSAPADAAADAGGTGRAGADVTAAVAAGGPSAAAAAEGPFAAAAAGRRGSRTPVWFMRQAGRSLPEYRAARAGTAMLEACRTPELVTEITLQPVRRYGVDAAVLYSDIVVPLAAAGVDLDIVPGTGPVIAASVRTAADVDALPVLDPAQVGFVDEAVRMLVPELGDVPLLGFAGAPFTLASYLVEGGPSRHHEATKAMMYGDPGLWHALMERLAALTTTFLRVQVEAGARAVQLFDSWVGALPLADYRRYVLPHSTAVLDGVADLGVPRIHFGTGTGELLGAMAEAGPEVVGVDFRVPLDEAARRTAAAVGRPVPLQGNLDPAALFAPWPVVRERVLEVLEAGRAAPGHVFNLGHGVLPSTDPDVLARVVDLVHETTTR